MNSCGCGFVGGCLIACVKSTDHSVMPLKVEQRNSNSYLIKLTMCAFNSCHRYDATAAKVGVCPPKRHLVEGAGMLKIMSVMIYCHFSVALLCLNVMFDLLLLGLPVFVLHKIRVLPSNLFLFITTSIINWTTPIVFTMPIVLSGTRIYCDDIDLLIESKSTNSLLLSNHGSRIDWMVGMFIGFSKSLAGKTCERIRVGFVCEVKSVVHCFFK